MRWALWFSLVGLLLAAAARTPPVATALATGLVTAGYGARHRYRARLRHHHDRLRLRAIERRLEAEDPQFAARLRSPTDPRPGPPTAHRHVPAHPDRGRADRPTGWLTAAAVLGVLLTAIGLVGDPGLAVVGALIAVGGVGLLVLPAGRSGPR
ncbi:DUF3040 family protein [Saccharothrix saharensis]|uniref:DUF3040 family protein n=1 Tax=Saccharothrix saharensis TaxID=571190 RepID=A0A543J720_9PSEU|nr:DUF3040 domain-containing protein [Saccharothrix saharensis]TQM78617.1 DUF3040 family protein [Saccharothrix saharensis]